MTSLKRKQINWLEILVQCKNNVREQITPFLGAQEQVQPELGTGAGGDPIRRIDLAAEGAIVDTLEDHEISFTLVSEESGIMKTGLSPEDHFVTIDPIDGTTNLMRGIPFYATSIAVSSAPIMNAVHAALVADLVRGITYTAQEGKGAFRNNQKVTPSRTESLEEAVVGVDLCTYKVQRVVSQLTGLIQQVKHIRHLGANALELCYVADGTTEAFLDIRGKLRTTDIAAAWLIVNEAGAKITTPDGESLKNRLGAKQKVSFIAAANQELHKNIVSLMKTEKET